MSIVAARAFGRAALVGHPSDNFPEHGYDGAVLAMTLWCFHCTVQVWESPEITICHNDRHFRSWDELLTHTARYGIFDEEPYLRAGLSVFGHHCRTHGLADRLDRNVSLRLLETNIPRQLGLSGSSAIVTAATRALMQFYAISEAEIPLTTQAWLVLQAEAEARTRGGLQDKLAQVYGAAGHGLVRMEFPAAWHGRPDGAAARCEPLDPGLLPPLALLYYPEGAKQSHQVHSRWDILFRQGGPEFLAAVRELPTLVPKTVAALQQRDWDEFGRLLDRGFELRLATCGTSAADLEAREMCRRRGIAFNQTGSGGAGILYSPDPARIAELRRELPEGWGLVELTPATAWEAASPRSLSPGKASGGTSSTLPKAGPGAIDPRLSHPLQP